jgi:endonuclease-3
MKRKERAALIGHILDTLFPDPKVPLKHDDPYTLLIAVLLSAQSTDVRVNCITPLLFAKASSPEAMIKLSIEEIEELIRPCGLGKAKSKAIWHLSKILIEKHHSEVPASFAHLENLPGVGHKTASVVMAQAFHISAFPVDTHIHRCAKRWGLSSASSVKQTEHDLKYLFPKNTWIRRHLQIIYFARTYCPALRHQSTLCPICSALPKD